MACSDNEPQESNEYEKGLAEYLAQYSVIKGIPEDGNLQTGDEAPFYQLIDDNSDIYIQVVRNEGTIPIHENIYYRYWEYSLKNYSTSHSLGDPIYTNADNIYNHDCFYYDSSMPLSLFKYPLKYVGNHSAVNIAYVDREGASPYTCVFYILYFPDTK
jgi:hypothetical protein